MTSVAVIGLGAMGAPIARRLKLAGFTLTVCDQRADSLSEFAVGGAAVAPDPADCTRADVVLVLVATFDQVHGVLLGDRGLVAGLADRPAPVVVVMSTVGPVRIRELDQTLRPLGVLLVDAPFSGGTLGATNGTLSIMVAGDRAGVAVAEPVLAVLGAELFPCGDVGNAQAVKLANNIVGIVNSFVAAEAFRFALESGLSLADTTPVMETSSGRNLLSATPDLPALSYRSWTHTRAGYESMRSIMMKDLDLIGDIAAQMAGEYPVLTQLSPILKSLGDETFDNWRRVAESGSAH